MLMLLSKWQYTSSTYYITPVQPDKPENGFVMRSAKTGEDYHPDYGDNWNTPDTLNYTTVKQRIAERHAYMGCVSDPMTPTPPPPFDPANSPKKWLCVSTVKKGLKPKKDGTISRTDLIKPNCQFAGRCHGFKNQDAFHVIHDPISNTFSLPELG
jgi:hypothetical protein